MTTLYSSIGGVDKSSITKRIDIWRESLNGIGRFEVLYDNTGHVLGGGVSAQDDVELRINTVSLLKGYVDDFLPFVRDQAAVYLELAKMLGRDYGQDLANLMLEKEYLNERVDDIIDDALATAVSEIVYMSPAAAAFHDASFKNHYLVNKFRDLVKLIDYDFYVNDVKVLHLFAFGAGAEASGVTLTLVADALTNTILSLDPIGEQIGWSIRNYIIVEAGEIDDHITEFNAGDYTNTQGVAVADSSGVPVVDFLAGLACIKATVTNVAVTQYFLTPVTVAKYSYTSFDYSQIASESCHCVLKHDDVGPQDINIKIEDNSGNTLEWNIPAAIAPDTWTEIIFPCGIEYGDGVDNWVRTVGAGPFDWEITQIGVTSEAPPVNWPIGTNVWLDGLYLAGINARSIADQTAPYGGHRKRMLLVSRPDLDSQRQLDDCSADELAKRQHPLQKLRLIAVGQTGLKYAGQTLTINAPSSGINTIVYRILTLHHSAGFGVNFRGYDFITELDLIKHTTVPGIQPVDPLRFKMTENPIWTAIRQLKHKIKILETIK